MQSKLKMMMMGLAAAALFAGCGKDAEKDPYDTPYARMHDPAYLSMLDQQRQEQRAVMKQVEVTRRAYAAEQQANPDSEKAKTLKKQLEDLQRELEFKRKVASEVVRQRMLQERQAIEAKSGKQNVKKGN